MKFCHACLTALLIAGMPFSTLAEDCVKQTLRPASTCHASQYLDWQPIAGDEDVDLILLCRDGYALAFNPMTRNPEWVVEILTGDMLPGPGDRDCSGFRQDPDLRVGRVDTRAKDADYIGSGFDRGHMAPAGDMRLSQLRMDESHYLTNIAPQVGVDFNRDVWKHLEARVRDWAEAMQAGRLIVVTGPVYLDENPIRFLVQNAKKPTRRITAVRIPDAYFKILYDTGRRRTLAFQLPNAATDDHSFPEFIVSIRTIEEQTGLDFFPHWSRRYANLKEVSPGHLWRLDRFRRPVP